MKRSAGVLIGGIVLLVGSLMILLLAVMVGIAFSVAPSTVPDTTTPAPAAFARFGLVVALVMILAPAIWGIITSVGVFRLKEWARISMIVIGVLTAFFNGCAAAIILALPLPLPQSTNMDAAVFSSIRIGIAVFYIVLVGIGVWWVVLFTRRSVKAQFASSIPMSAPAFPAPSPASGPTLAPPTPGAEPPPVGRPLGISIIAWVLVATAAFFPVNLLFRAPVLLLGKVLMGPPAMATMAGFTAINVALGIGLLRLNARAWRLTIAYLLFGIVNSAVSVLGPGREARIAAILNAQPAFVRQANAQAPFDLTPFLWIGMTVGALVVAVALYVLIKARPAFDRSIRNSNHT